MPLKFLVTVGKWSGSKYDYLTNFFTQQVGATIATPRRAIDLPDVLSTFSEISAHGYVYAVVPDSAPNALYVINRLLSVERNEPILALNIHVQEFDYNGAPKALVNANYGAFLHDVKLLEIKSTYTAGSLANPDGSRTTVSDMTAGFRGVPGPIQKIGRSVY